MGVSNHFGLLLERVGPLPHIEALCRVLVNLVQRQKRRVGIRNGEVQLVRIRGHEVLGLRRFKAIGDRRNLPLLLVQIVAVRLLGHLVVWHGLLLCGLGLCRNGLVVE